MKVVAGWLVVGSWLAVALHAGAGETYVWTGAEDAYWTNAANWQVGGAAPDGQNVHGRLSAGYDDYYPIGGFGVWKFRSQRRKSEVR